MAVQKTVGVDIGGTHITAALVDLKEGTLLADTHIREHVDAKGNKTNIIHSWAQGIKNVTAGSAPEELRIGIAMPGPFDYAKGISLMQNQEKYDALYGINVKELLADALQVPPAHIQFMNDAACFLQGEAFGGAAKGAERAIGLTLGTGLGSAFYRDGMAEDAALWRSPFKEGIAEDYLSSRWFTKRYHSLSGNEVPNVKSLVELLPSDALVQSILDEFGRHLGQFLRLYIDREKPEVIVIGGNIAQSLELFKPALLKTLASQGISAPVKQGELGEAAALIGAASLWK
ncbi:ROK family protein [Pontibacter diazotrophicus]|uniref:ROK family protein n=1 Tax=Pontibacter diazotrophicus TaxID=1400979 RepID=A0A3D8L9C4_9BACT|nr:ROK family protein [Pontibacter diazotrophicus]RDV13582.1 ROK family protein [Pontibacter diazotrophicus]